MINKKYSKHRTILTNYSQQVTEKPWWINTKIRIECICLKIPKGFLGITSLVKLKLRLARCTAPSTKGLRVIKQDFSSGVPVVTIPCHVNRGETVAMRGGRGPARRSNLTQAFTSNKTIQIMQPIPRYGMFTVMFVWFGRTAVQYCCSTPREATCKGLRAHDVLTLHARSQPCIPVTRILSNV